MKFSSFTVYCGLFHKIEASDLCILKLKYLFSDRENVFGAATSKTQSKNKIKTLLMPVPLSGLTKKSLVEYGQQNIKPLDTLQVDRAGSSRSYKFDVYDITNPQNPDQVCSIKVYHCII